MKTNQVMETVDRELCGVIVSQRTQDSFFSLAKIMLIINNARAEQNINPVRLDNVFKLDTFKEFMAELDAEIGSKSYIPAKKGGSGWVHPFLALKMLTHYNPKLELQVYKWLMDYLIENRISSGDSYTRMCGVLYRVTTDKLNFSKNIKNLAKIIKKIIGVDEWNTATEKQLKQRDRLQNLIIDFSLAMDNATIGTNTAIKYFQRTLIEEQKVI